MDIRNFVIIAHIDSGKSTLADRLLEITGTVPARQMKPQYLDRLPLERERGITIKMAPVRMAYNLDGSDHILNLIDTPGHSDFSYEVSRALAAVEGAVLLIDGTRGIQAQTLSNLRMARKAGLKIIGAVNKIDLTLNNLDKIVKSTAELLGVSEREIFKVSAKTGDGVKELLDAVVRQVPAAKDRKEIMMEENTENDFRQTAVTPARALVFDSLYDDHKGILAFVRVFNGEIDGGEEAALLAAGAKFKIKEVGFFSPDFKPTPKLHSGEIGYIATGLKEPELVKIGDTICGLSNSGPQIAGLRFFALVGYREPAPVVFISLYPDGATKFEDLKRGLERLRLTDAALSFEPEANDALGRGLKVGFLGQLHFEIAASRLKDEFGLEFLTSFPSIAYRVAMRDSADSRGSGARIDADKDDLLYKDLTYKIRGCFFNAYNALGSGQKEDVYHKTLELEFAKAGLGFEKEKAIEAKYDNRNIGAYRPDFIVEDKIIIEVKALPVLAALQKQQTWNYLKGSTYKLALLVNFGGKKLEIERMIYDTARHDSVGENPRSNQRKSAMVVKTITQPQDFPDNPEKVWQPMIKIEILAQTVYLNQIINLKNVFDLEIKEIQNFGEGLLIIGRMPLSELIRDFDDRLKSATAGYASFIYELDGEAEAEVEKLQILIVGEEVAALTRIVAKKDLEKEGRQTVERLKNLLPKQQFSQAIQAKAMGRIIARETIPAMKKLLGNFGKTGGDRTRKMKLWKKQQRGKERLQGMARVELSPEVFREILKK